MSRCRSSRCRSRWRDARVALVTTAAPYQPDAGDQGPRRAVQRRRPSSTPCTRATPRATTTCASRHVAIDRQHTTAEDPGSYFPLAALRRAAATGRIGPLAPRFHGAPTNRSQRTTLEVDCPEIVARCQADAVDAAILVANCPVCHQSVSLVARAARARRHRHRGDGLRQGHRRARRRAAPPVLRFPARQRRRPAARPRLAGLTLELALRLLEAAPAPRTTVQSPLRWSDDPDWKLDYCNIDRLSPEEIARRRAEFDEAKRQAKALRSAG